MVKVFAKTPIVFQRALQVLRHLEVFLADLSQRSQFQRQFGCSVQPWQG